MCQQCGKYQPSNGTEGVGFIENYCMNCIHEKFMHTNNHDDAKCDILSRTMLYNYKDAEYPQEWVYDENCKGICTAYRHWDWGVDDGEGGGLNEPPPPEPYNPKQMVLPFFTNDILKDHQTKELA